MVRMLVGPWGVRRGLQCQLRSGPPPAPQLSSSSSPVGGDGAEQAADKVVGGKGVKDGEDVAAADASSQTTEVVVKVCAEGSGVLRRRKRRRGHANCVPMVGVSGKTLNFNLPLPTRLCLAEFINQTLSDDDDDLWSFLFV